MPLILNKMEKIEEVSNLYERYMQEENEMLKELLRKQLLSMTETACEYSGMVDEILSRKGIANV
ncbi:MULTISPECIES: hypothetical protein [unclassified Oleiphilus]|uniref:hypothetical protein n=1 Tax=unclassified Oleiphilus TaxID=2631174 RepID=UPI0007C3FE91|nr:MULTISPECIES: hypothetical protein [unclassified Oleiphilus]KZY86094.1 hypothetical protein A3743_17695 [Oleiphilus sp. HI0072]KZZ31507.1 hypothetical protein A3755_11675 [Oleiphilus sp. HI0085]